MITSGIVVAGHHGQAQADLAEAKLPILLRGKAQCPSSFRGKINFGMKTSAYEKKCQFQKCRNTALANDFKHLGLLGRSLDKWENEELVQNSSYPWTSGSHLGLLGQSLDQWENEELVQNSSYPWTTGSHLGLLGQSLD